MKKSIILGVLFLISIYSYSQKGTKLASTNSTSERIVLCEIFTSTTCPPCASFNPVFDSWLKGYANASRVAVIKYHVWWPALGDPYYAANMQDVKDRVNYYSVNGVPSLITDGKTESSYYNYTISVPNDLSSPGQFEISISPNISSNPATIDVTVKSDGTVILSGLVIHTAIVESGLRYTGSNGDPNHEYVMRKMLPNSSGESLSMSPNDTRKYTRTVAWDPTWVIENCKIIAFIQNVNTKQILQAGMKALSTKPSLSVSASSFNLKYKSGNFSTTVSNSGIGTMNWNAIVTSGSEWLTLSNASGTNLGTFITNYSENKGALRIGKIQVSAPNTTGSPAEITITQAGAPVDWILQTYKNISFYSVSAPADNIGYAVGSGGTIIKTIDGGKTWVNQSSGTYYPLYKVSFSDINTGSAAGYGGIILRTTNGGVSWQSQSSGTTGNFNSVNFANTNVGVAVGNSGMVYKTTNGGAKWTAQISGTSYYLNDVFCLDALNYYIVGPYGLVLHTTNGGLNWTTQKSGTTNQLMSIFFVNNNLGFAVGASGTIIKTTNGGNTWQSIGLNGITSFLTSLSFSDENNGFVVGYSGLILKTTNGGINWSTQESGIWDNLWGISRKNDFGLIVGVNGTILSKASQSSSTTAVKENYELKSINYELKQNYPNPFNPSTVISYQLPLNTYVSLKIYNSLGQEMQTLVDKQQQAGNYDIEWAPGNTNGGLPSGVYFYILQTDKYREVKKMIYIR